MEVENKHFGGPSNSSSVWPCSPLNHDYGRWSTPPTNYYGTPKKMGDPNSELVESSFQVAMDKGIDPFSIDDLM